MDIHRCRFVAYPASAINAVAFSHTSLPFKKHKNTQVRLAIGRANGDIEIWNPLGGVWHQELVIHGGRERSIDGLVWITEPDEEIGEGKFIYGKSRLFSIGYTTTVTEWDLQRAKAKKHASGQHGDIWCLGAQPLPSDDSKPGSGTRKLVAGTVDGSLILYSTEDEDLVFERVMVKTPSKKIKMVSIAFQSRKVVAVGCSDSTIRIYDMQNGTLLRQMTLGSDLSGGPKDIIVWSVKSLPNGDIVSGDSIGQVCIWDGKTYTQAQRIQSHTQDVLSLAISSDGSRIISGGMDRRTVLYEPMSGHDGRWTKVWHRRYHTHDVKAMASFEGRAMSVVVSGGPDATPIVIPLRAAGKENHRILPHLPQDSPLASARKARLIISWWERQVYIWKLVQPVTSLLDNVGSDAEYRKNRKLLGRILIKGDSNVTSATISEDGDLLLVSTASEIKTFQLNLQQGQKGEELKIAKVKLMPANHGATKVQISADKKWVCWIEEGSRVVVAKVDRTESTDGHAYSIPRSWRLSRLRRNIPKHYLLGGLGAYDRIVTQVCFSSDGKMLAVADLAGYIDTWVLRQQEERAGGKGGEEGDDEGDEEDDEDDEDDDVQPRLSTRDPSDEKDNEGFRWVRNPNASLIPKLLSAPVILSFSDDLIKPRDSEEGGGDDDYTLLAITTSMHVLTFNPLRGSLSNWSRRNPHAKIPEKFRTTRDLVKGVVWQGPRIWFYGISFLFMLNLSLDLIPTSKEASDSKGGLKQQGVKRKRPEQNSGAGSKMEKYATGPQNVKTLVELDSNEWMDVEMADADDQKSIGASSRFEDDDDDEDTTDGGELQSMRNAPGADGEVSGKEHSKKAKTKWWHTYKYRPILGIVPLAREEQADGGVNIESGVGKKKPPPIEVALVERPLWDVDLPPRYLADGE